MRSASPLPGRGREPRAPGIDQRSSQRQSDRATSNRPRGYALAGLSARCARAGMTAEPRMQFWIIQTLNSIAFGGLLFLLSSGFSLAFGLMRIPNLAHGGFFMLGAYFGATITYYGGNFWIAVLGAGLGVGLVGILFERLHPAPACRQCAGPGAGHARRLLHHRRPVPADLDRRPVDRAGAGRAAPAAALLRASRSRPSASWCSASRWSPRSRSIC